MTLMSETHWTMPWGKLQTPCFSNGSLLIAHCSSTNSHSLATAAGPSPSQWSQQHLHKILKSFQSSQEEARKSPDPEFRSLLPHGTKLRHKENTLANCYIIVGKHEILLKTFTNETQLPKLNTRCLLQCVALID